MGNVIDLKARKKPVVADPEAVKLVAIANEIDAVLLRYLATEQADARDLAGVLAHRLGTLMRHLEGKLTLWHICEKVLKNQAALE